MLRLGLKPENYKGYGNKIGPYIAHHINIFWKKVDDFEEQYHIYILYKE